MLPKAVNRLRKHNRSNLAVKPALCRLSVSGERSACIHQNSSRLLGVGPPGDGGWMDSWVSPERTESASVVMSVIWL